MTSLRSQDLDFDGAVAMYVNRRYMVEFLDKRVYGVASHENKLEDAIYVTHTKLEYVAMMRANCVIDLRISLPWRFLSGKGADLDNWSPFSQGIVLDLINNLSERVSQDPSILLDPRTDIWKDIKATEPKFKEYFDHLEADTILAPDGKTKHKWYTLALAEALDPADETNRATRDLTLEYLRTMFTGGYAKLHDNRTVLPQYLTSEDGALSFGNQAQGHADGKGCETTNDKFSESVFGESHAHTPGFSSKYSMCSDETVTLIRILLPAPCMIS